MIKVRNLLKAIGLNQVKKDGYKLVISDFITKYKDNETWLKALKAFSKDMENKVDSGVKAIDGTYFDMYMESHGIKLSISDKILWNTLTENYCKTKEIHSVLFYNKCSQCDGLYKIETLDPKDNESSKDIVLCPFCKAWNIIFEMFLAYHNTDDWKFTLNNVKRILFSKKTSLPTFFIFTQMLDDRGIKVKDEDSRIWNLCVDECSLHGIKINRSIKR